MTVIATPEVLAVLQTLDDLSHAEALRKAKEENAHRNLNGDFYEGQYAHDQRQGHGRYTWFGGTTYDGTFFADKMHGFGHLESSEVAFVGTFFLDKRSGFGIARFSNSVLFQGFYVDDERCGSGIQIYNEQSSESLCADVGQWRHNRLVKLSVELPEAVNPLTEFPDYMWYADTWSNSRSGSLVSERQPSVSVEEVAASTSMEIIKNLSARKPVHVWESASIEFERDTAYEAFVRLIKSSKEWESCQSRWPLEPVREDDLRTDPRLSAFVRDLAKQRGLPSTEEATALLHPLGPHSQAALQFLKLCQSSNNPVVRSLLSRSLSSQSELESTRSVQVDVNVADAQDRTALLIAALSLNVDLVKVLLDFGADPNQVCIGNLTVLNICIMRYFRQKTKAKTHNKAQLTSRSKNHLIMCSSCIENEVPRNSELDSAEQTDCESGSPGASEESGCKALKKKIWHRAELRWQLTPERAMPLAAAPTLPRLIIDSDGGKPDTSRLPTATLKTTNKSLTAEPKFTPISRFKNIFSTGHEGIPGISRVNNPGGKRESFTLELCDEPKEHLPPLRLKSPPIYTKHMSRKQFVEALNSQLAYEAPIEEPRELATPKVRRLIGLDGDPAVAGFHYESESSGLQTEENPSIPGQLTRPGSSVRLSKKSRLNEMFDMARLLLSRGARPNSSDLPIPALTMAVQAGDVYLTRLLLLHGADANAKLPDVTPDELKVTLISDDGRRFSPSLGGLAALHFAVLLPRRAGVEITEMLLDALADPNARASPDLSFLTDSQCAIRQQLENGDIGLQSVQAREEYAVDGGRTPLHLVCSRDYDTANATRIVHLLLQRGADPNMLCNGHSALSLAIASGNEHTEASLRLTHGLGNALCVAASPQYEFRWPLESRLRLIKKLIDARPFDLMLTPVRCQPDCSEGNVIDYIYSSYAQDRSVFGKAFYALTVAERNISVGRAAVLELLAQAMRDVGHQFGALMQSKESSGSGTSNMLYRYCYECGRSASVKLVPCTRCNKVFYCSTACKFKGWTNRHRKECQPTKSLSRKEKPPVKVKIEVKAPVEPKFEPFHAQVTAALPSSGGPP
nr:unnamed protein product [Spirometra erinaceieuropaei]